MKSIPKHPIGVITLGSFSFQKWKRDVGLIKYPKGTKFRMIRSVPSTRGLVLHDVVDGYDWDLLPDYYETREAAEKRIVK